MFIRNLTNRGTPILFNNKPMYFLLDQQKMDIQKQIMFVDKERTMMLKAKFVWRQIKYTMAQGFRDLWGDAKWLINIKKKKEYKDFTGLQMKNSARIKIDLIKFIPYSVILVVPFAELSLPFLLWLFPYCVPSFFVFDTAEDKRIQILEKRQQESYEFLIQKLTGILRNLSKKEEQFTNYEDFKRDFFEIIDDLTQKLDYHTFTSDQLIQVLQFMGTHYMTGTAIFNKVINLFTLNIPSLLLKIYLYIKSKITHQKLGQYKNPWWIKGNFKLFKFNIQPFQYFKRKFLISQINKNFKAIKDQDEAFQKFGMEDVSGYEVRQFARQRGLASLSCYVTLKNVFANDWIKVTTHPKFSNNTKLWYSVMLYHFMKQSNRDLN